MKIRTITYGLTLNESDFRSDSVALLNKINAVKTFLVNAKNTYEKALHPVQTFRIALNSFEDWLIPLLPTQSLEAVIKQLDQCLEKADIDFCSVGSCTSPKAIALIPEILRLSRRFSSSVTFDRESLETSSVSNSNINVGPDRKGCKLAAEACLRIAKECGDLGNFRFGVSFNTSSRIIPFFPAASHRTGYQSTVSLGLECGDMIFLAFHGADSLEEGRDNLVSVLRQVLLPLQEITTKLCSECSIEYAGIDASMNPGLELPYSVCAGLEDMIQSPNKHFGEMGTLAAVSAVTSAIKQSGVPFESDEAKSSPSGQLKLTGYSGLMLPVMEDIVLAQRASEGRFGLRDLMAFSSVCGVGLDTVPIPGDTTVEQLAGVYEAVGALSFRLDKPLSCRLLPLEGKAVGDTTEVDSPYLCNTTVFSIP